ncbi:hypothetical protein Ancab_039193, partial [Ancistrocladus abbreviatus]
MKLLQFGLVLVLASGLSALLIYITGISNLGRTSRISVEDLEALQTLHSSFQQCV